MENKKFLIGLFLGLILVNLSFAEPINPNNVTECDTLGVPNTIYNITTDISASWNCFRVFADNITIDCP